MLSVRLPKDIEDRLDILAKSTGRTKAYYVREAIEQKLEDIEDIYMAQQVLERIRAGEEEVISLEQMERELGLEG